MKIAIVTPYYKEPKAMLERCMRSVRAQTVAPKDTMVDHIMVADGHEQDWIDGHPVRHLKLDCEHGDYGNTPRGLGALLAIAERYDAIGLLDADNWLEPDHVQECLRAAAVVPGGAAECDYVVARRCFRRPDETLLPHAETSDHVDTSCFFFLPGAYAVLPIWAMMPREMSPFCDNVFFQSLSQNPFRYAETSKITVNFHCTYEEPYLAIGETPPPNAKPSRDMRVLVMQWLDTLTPRQLLIESRLTGLDLLKR